MNKNGPNFQVEVDENEHLSIIPDRVNKSWVNWFLIGVPLLSFLICYFVFKGIKRDSINWKWDLLHIIGFAIFIILIIVIYFNKLSKLIKNTRKCVLRKNGDTIFFNDKKLSSEVDLIEVIIHPAYGGYMNYTLHYSVGLKYKSGSKPLYFYETEANAKYIAGVIGSYLSLPINIRKPQWFSFLTKF